MRAYYFDNIEGDQRLPHDCKPSQPVDPDQLKRLGILHWSIPVENYGPKLDAIAHEREYKNRDTISVSKEGLGDMYEAKIRGFFQEHMHEDEEIRYILSGSGFFDIRESPSDAWIRLAVEPSDLIVLPAGIYHRFTLDEADNLKALRLFKDEPKWIPHNRSAETDINTHRIAYLTGSLTPYSIQVTTPRRPLPPMHYGSKRQEAAVANALPSVSDESASHSATKQSISWGWSAVGAIILLSVILATAITVYLVRRARKRKLLKGAVSFEPPDVEGGTRVGSFDATEKLDGEESSQNGEIGAYPVLPKDAGQSPTRKKASHGSGRGSKRSASPSSINNLARPAVRSEGSPSSTRRPSSAKTGSDSLSQPPPAVVKKGRRSPVLPGADEPITPPSLRTTYDSPYNYPT